MSDTDFLFFIAKKASLYGGISSSTAKIAAQFGISQQSVSRKLRQLQQNGLIELQASANGVKIRLLEKGISLLKKQHLELKGLFEAKPLQSMSGRVKIGLGEGAYYVSQPEYSRQFRQSLGFKPYPGTLNLIVDEEALSGFLVSVDEVGIKGFKTTKRSFGPITAFRVLVGGKQEAAILFPERSSHPKNEIEVISPVFLRQKLKLKEGSTVKLFRAEN